MWSKLYRLPTKRDDIPGIIRRTILREANDGLFQGALIFEQAKRFVESKQWALFVRLAYAQCTKNSGVSQAWCLCFLDEDEPFIFNNFHNYTWNQGDAIYVRRSKTQVNDVMITMNDMSRPALLLSIPNKGTTKFQIGLGQFRLLARTLPRIGSKIEDLKQITRMNEKEIADAIKDAKTKLPPVYNDKFSMPFVDPDKAFSTQICETIDRLLSSKLNRTERNAIACMKEMMSVPLIRSMVDEFILENRSNHWIAFSQMNDATPIIVRSEMNWKLSGTKLIGTDPFGRQVEIADPSISRWWFKVKDGVSELVQLSAGSRCDVFYDDVFGDQLRMLDNLLKERK